jgi:transposase
MCVLAGYVVPVLQNGALNWKKKTDWSQISRSDQPSHINARRHTSGAVSEILEKCGWQVLLHPPCSPDMRPPGFDFFPKLKKPLREKRFRSFEELAYEVTPVIRRINNEGVLTGIQEFSKRWTAVIKHSGDYIEGL